MPSDEQTDSSCEIHCIDDDKKTHNQQQTYFLSSSENSLTGSNIPVEPTFIEYRVREHNIALAVQYIALPSLEAHGAK